MMKLAIFDIGSNSIRLMTGEKIGDTWHNEPKRLWTTRLGQRTAEGLLSEVAMEASIQAIKEGLQGIPEEYTANAVGLATGAVREAPNGEAFCQQVQQETGLAVRIITGREEGHYGFIGATADFLSEGKLCAVIDIGGATTEVTLGTKDKIERVASYPIGAVRFQSISDEGLQRVWEETKGFWNPLLMEDDFIGCIGIGGTVTTLAAIDLKLEQYDPKKVHGHILRRETVEFLALQLRYMSTEERVALPGLPATRQDIIVCGTEILASFMDTYDLGAIIVSEKDGMEGWEEIECHEP